MPSPSTYRRNVAAVVINDAGELLACERSDRTDAWQLPQGGIEDDENPKEALFRELEEEIGTSNIKIVDQLDEVIRYDWPKRLYKRGHRGQEQYYFLVTLLDEAEIDLSSSDEFQRAEWMKASKFLKRIQGFKVEAYTTAIKLFSDRNPSIFK